MGTTTVAVIVTPKCAHLRSLYRHSKFILSVLGRGFYTTIKARKGGGTAAGLRCLAERSRGCDKVAFPLNSAAAKTTNIPTLRLQPLILLFVFGRTT
mmetsp:Transcript_27323/g.44842  ORF Transcript_27323/g.44842 Transcript_27323/m.44842 type:complete len:97 (+) Transcript_27323:73-363(+)